MRFPILMLSLFCLLTCKVSAENSPGGSQNTPAKITSDDTYGAFLINNIFNYYGNNGDGSFNKARTDNEGFEFTAVQLQVKQCQLVRIGDSVLEELYVSKYLIYRQFFQKGETQDLQHCVE